MSTTAPNLIWKVGAAVLTLRKPTPIKAFPYFHCVSLKTRCKIRESYFAVLIVRPVRNKKMLPHRFRWGIDYVRSFIIFLFCRFEPRPLKSTHDFWCGCPQPGVLKIGKFPFEKNYSNAPKSREALKSLISRGVWRFFILIFTGEKEHKIGSKNWQKHKK